MMTSVRRITVLSALALCLHLQAAVLHARGGGGCVEQGTPVLTPAGPVAIERLRPGDTVLGVSGDALLPVTVRSVMQVQPDEYFELTVNGVLLRVTSEHPVETASGVFRMASHLRQGDAVILREGRRTVSAAVSSVTRVRNSKPAFNLLVSPAGTYLANNIVVHNKGCFLPDTPVRKADGTDVPIADVRPGDRLLAFTADGTVVSATVRRVLTHEVEEYRIVRTESMVLQVTAEHPFSVGAGTFKTLEALRAGDTIYAYDGTGLRAQQITSIESIAGPARVYNLMTDAPHTFFANGIAVHNKGGGGGCFPAGTPVLTPQGEVPIERIRPGDKVTAVGPDGSPVEVQVRETHARRSPLLVVQTTRGGLRTTAEHPLAMASGGYRPAGEINPGEAILAWRDGTIITAIVTGKLRGEEDEPVFNLTVDGPHTYIACGFVVHNKGGGGGYRSSGRSSSSGSRGGGSSGADGFIAFMMISTIVIVVIIVIRKSKTGNLDQLFSREDIEKKSAKTIKLIEFIAKQDSTVVPETLRKTVETTFRKLQQCWQARAYEPMKPLLMPDLFQDHMRQIEGMKRNHEINMIDGLRVDAIDLVNVRYPQNRHEREFTALITAMAEDYYVDDRTGEKRRGDDSLALFQEFWTFQYHHDAWLLREIEQTAESDILGDDNYFEQFTDKAIDQVYGEAAGKEGPAGPWTEGETLVKERRIERLLNHLVRTDKLWAKNRMLQTARSTFIALTGAWESGTLAVGLKQKLFPDLFLHLSQAMEKNGQEGITLEFRNLAVRKAELVLVKNFTDNRNDEFVVRIRAHAQKGAKQGGSTLHQDEDVTAFEEYLTFGRDDGQWKLKEIIAPYTGKDLVAVENVEEGSSPQLIEWYYQHKRAG